MRFKLSLFTVAFVLAAFPAHAAFEPLSHLLAALHDPLPQSGFVFVFADPQDTLSASIRDRNMVWPFPMDMNGPFSNPSPALTLTGIDFRQVTAGFQTGDPPGTVTVFTGPEGFTANVPDALLARGFTTLPEQPFPTFAQGEDFAISIANRNPNDPFGGSMGRSQRIAIGDDFIVSTAGTAPIAAAMQGLAASDDCTVCLPWRTMLDAIALEAGDMPTVEGAIGLTSAPFSAPNPNAQASSKGKQLFTLFTSALLAQTRSASNTSVHLAALYDSRTLAEQAGATMAKRLAQGVSLTNGNVRDIEPTTIEQRMTNTPLGTALVITLQFPESDPEAGRQEFANWHRALLRSDFYPLMVFEAERP